MERVPAPPYKPSSHLTQLDAIVMSKSPRFSSACFSFQLQNTWASTERHLWFRKQRSMLWAAPEGTGLLSHSSPPSPTIEPLFIRSLFISLSHETLACDRGGRFAGWGVLLNHSVRLQQYSAMQSQTKKSPTCRLSSRAGLQLEHSSSPTCSNTTVLFIRCSH